MMDDRSLDGLGSKLSCVKYNPIAKARYELLSDSLIWEDEFVEDLCNNEFGCLKALFRFRTSLVTGISDDRFKDLWNKAKKKFPNWIGFRKDRCNFDSELKKIYLIQSHKDPIFGTYLIEPYIFDNIWVFDDENIGLCKEPLVEGADKIINVLVKDIPNAKNGFRLKFSEYEFSDYQVKLKWRRKEIGGDVYYCFELDQEGWVCSALLHFFYEPPEEIYIQCEAGRSESQIAG